MRVQLCVLSAEVTTTYDVRITGLG